MRVSSLVALHALVAVAAFAAPAQAGGDPLQPAQWALDAVAAPDAWQSATGRGAIIAVVDTGVDRDHAECQGRLLPGASWVWPGGVQAPCGDWDDRNGHGTHVAGIAAAPLDGRGTVGVAEDAKILPVRVLDDKGVGSPRRVAVRACRGDLVTCVSHDRRGQTLTGRNQVLVGSRAIAGEQQAGQQRHARCKGRPSWSPLDQHFMQVLEPMTFRD